MIEVNLLDLIPQELKQLARDALVDFVSDQAKEYLSDRISDKIKLLRSDAAFQRQFEAGLERAIERFIAEYELKDEDLVAAIAADDSFFQNQEVQEALLTIIKHPGAYLVEEQDVLRCSFDSVLVSRKNRERVDQAVIHLLKCLAEELWHLPELQPIYSLQFQRMTAEAAMQQVELQKAQLREVSKLNRDLQDVLLKLADEIARHKLLSPGGHKAPSFHPEVFHNLPQPDYGQFIGREQELEQVLNILLPYPRSQYPLVTITGIGGIGKTTLALHVAHRFLRDYDHIPEEARFKAIIWTSAKQTVLTAEDIMPRRQALRTLEDIYSAIAITLRREDIILTNQQNQTELLRSALAQQRSLLVVDNLETIDDDAVLQFLRELPAPTKAIVTTRHRIDVAYPLRLVGMRWNDVQKLVAQESREKDVKLSQEEVAQLYRRTGGVPLAIVWSIAQIGFGYSIEAVLERLGQPSSDVARFCFNNAIDLIHNKPAYTLLGALAMFPFDASREALGLVTRFSVLDRDDGLVMLDKLSLVNKQENRFSLLPLTKEYARNELIDSALSTHLQDQIISYYQDCSEKYSSPNWNWKNYAWLLPEGENILGLIDWAVEIDRPKVALSFTRPLMRYLDIQGRWGELANYGERLYRLAQVAREDQTRAWICVHWLGWLYAEQDNSHKAETFAREGIDIYQSIGNLKGECLARIALARALRRGAEYAESEQVCRDAMRLSAESGYGDGIASAHAELAKLARDRMDWETSRGHWDQAIEWCEKHPDEADLDISFLMGALGNLGWIEYKLGNPKRGKELIERSLGFFTHMGGRGYATSLNLRMAIIEKALGNERAALEFARESAYWAEKLEMRSELEAVQKFLGENLVDTTSLDKPKATPASSQ